MRLSDLQDKNVINIKDGKLIGNIIDIMITKDGILESFIVEKTKFLLSKFSSSGEIEIRYNQIIKIGDDVILVDI